MLATAIILFREVLEISLILSVVLVATRGIPGRMRWIWLGIGGGALGSALIALFAQNIASAMEGVGQEVFNACILLAAAAMIGWTVIWMQTHGRELSAKFNNVGKSVREGETPLYVLAVVISLSIWREGAEIVLFMTGILSTTQDSLLSIMTGGMLGAVAAATIGLLIYFGLLKLSVRHLFSTTGILLTLLAAGLTAQAAGYLSAAGLIPDLIPELWDTSAILSTENLLGSIAHSLLGYTERPSGVQLLFYVVTLGFITLMTRKYAPQKSVK